MSRDYYVFDEEYKTELKPYLDLTKNTFFQDPDYSCYFNDSFQEYVDSAEFKNFSLQEQKMADLAINACMDNKPWHIQEFEPDDELFTISKSLYQVKANKTDAAVLSGMTGWQIESELLDYDGITLKKEIGNVALRDYVNLGLAVVLNAQERSTNGHHALSYYTEDSGTTLRQTVGGTTHGDFTAGWARYASHGPALDPSCQKRLFAPAIERNGVNAYHSVEDSLAITMLGYLAKNDNNLLEKYKRIILDSIDKADLGRGGGPFADFGDDSLLREFTTSRIYTHKKGHTLQKKSLNHL